MNTHKDKGVMKFGDLVYVGFTNGVIIRVITKRKWTYYDIVFEDAKEVTNDWDTQGVECETYREDKISKQNP